MKLTRDESKALTLIAVLLVLAGAVHLLDRDEPLDTDAAALDLESLEAASTALLAAEERRNQPLEEGERLDPNTEEVDELTRLPGIGQAIADRLVAERTLGGPFASLDDLTRVPGIGPTTVERLAPHLDLPERPPGSSSALRHPVSQSPTTGETLQIGRPVEAASATDLGEADSIPVVDPNRASAAELEQLPGIGPVIAERILAFRDSAGPFRNVSDLEHVSGIGAATIARIEPHLRIR